MKLNTFRAASFVSLLVLSTLSSASVAQGTITFDPDPPVAGKSARLIYDAKGGPLAGKSTVAIHYGINDWKGIVQPDPKLTKVETDKWELKLDVPADATALDFVFSDGGNTWDNNKGADWHVVTANAVPPVSLTPNPPKPGEPVTIRYSPTGSALEKAEKVYIHVGYNDWKNVTAPNPELKKNQDGLFECTLPLAADVHEMNFVFTDGGQLWDNNGAQDWTVPVGDGAVAAEQVSDRVSISPNPPVRGEEATITYDAAGSLLSSQVPVFIQLGYDGWKEAEGPDPAMKRVEGKAGVWQHTFMVWEQAKRIEMSFSDGDDKWDNNGKKDWNFETSGPAGISAAK